MVLYIGNISKKISIEQIKSYLTKRNISILGLFKLNRQLKSDRDNYDSYKLIIDQNFLSLIINSSFWPKGIAVRPWSFRQTDENAEPVKKITTFKISNHP